MKERGKKLPKEKIGKFMRIFNLFIVFIIFIIGLYAFMNYVETVEYFSKNIGNYGLSFLFISVFLLDFLPQVISPDFTLLLALGIGMNIYSAVIITIVASSLGSALAFLVGYHYGFKTIAPLFKQEDLDKTLKFWGKHGKWFVLASATLPIPIPYFPLIFGALRMKKSVFIIWGIIPRAIGFIVTGALSYLWINGFL